MTVWFFVWGQLIGKFAPASLDSNKEIELIITKNIIKLNLPQMLAKKIQSKFVVWYWFAPFGLSGLLLYKTETSSSSLGRYVYSRPRNFIN